MGNEQVPGMVYTANVARVKELAVFCAEVWLITRAGADIPGTVQVRALSPGPALYGEYLRNWKGSDPAVWWPLKGRRH